MRLTLILMMTLTWLGIAPAPATAGETGLVAGQSAAHCMSACIKHEGNSPSAKSTCKLRCANVAVPSAKSPPKRDCMAVYKKCNRSCKKSNKPCRRECKTGLMGCG